jgi:hypothetical protein
MKKIKDILVENSPTANEAIWNPPELILALFFE